MPSIRQAKLEQAKAYILAHPDEAKHEQAAGSGLSMGTISTARAALIKEGKLMPSRKNVASDSDQLAKNWSGKAAEREGPDEPPAPLPAGGLMDHAAMLALAGMGDDLDHLDDEQVRQRMHRQCVRFMFDPKLHPDTRMSASQMWEKLKEKSKTKDLGPGAPVTFEEGVARLSDLFEACGPKMVLAAVNVAFNVQETPDGAKDEQAQPAGGAEEAPSPA